MRLRDKVRVVFTYASTPEKGQVTTIKWIEEASMNSGMELVALNGFRKPEDRLAYQQYLLNWNENNLPDGTPMGLVLSPEAPPRKSIFSSRSSVIMSRVSRPSSSRTNVALTVQTFLDTKSRLKLVPASDEDKLKAWRQDQGGSWH